MSRSLFHRACLGAVASAALCLGLGLGLAGCSQDSTAATVNSKEIKESTVTSYVQDFRNASDLGEESAWATYLITSSLTPSAVRSSVISYYENYALMEQGAEELGVSVSDEEVASRVQQDKEATGTDEDWASALKQNGYSEQTYKESVHQNLLQAAITEKICGEEQEASDKDTLAYLQQYQEYFQTMKRYAQITFKSDDRATAEQVAADLSSGKISFADAAKKYSTADSASKGGDEGWDVLTTNLSSKATDALSELKKDQVSDLITDDAGIHLFTVTKVFTAPEKITKLSQMPDEAVQLARDAVTSTNKSNAFNSWLEELKSKAEIKENEMPSGLPYDVNLDEYQDAASDSSSDSSTDDAAAASDSSSSSDTTDEESTEQTSSDDSK